MGKMFVVAVTVAGLAYAPAALAAGAVSAGQQVYASQCAMCHSNQPGGQGIGPSLAGVYGKPAASQPGYDFSRALKNAHLTWNDATLNKFLAGPQAMVPGTKMTFEGVDNAQARADVIAYIASLAGR